MTKFNSNYLSTSLLILMSATSFAASGASSPAIEGANQDSCGVLVKALHAAYPDTEAAAERKRFADDMERDTKDLASSVDTINQFLAKLSPELRQKIALLKAAGHRTDDNRELAGALYPDVNAGLATALADFPAGEVVTVNKMECPEHMHLLDDKKTCSQDKGTYYFSADTVPATLNVQGRHLVWRFNASSEPLIRIESLDSSHRIPSAAADVDTLISGKPLVLKDVVKDQSDWRWVPQTEAEYVMKELPANCRGKSEVKKIAEEARSDDAHKGFDGVIEQDVKDLPRTTANAAGGR